MSATHSVRLALLVALLASTPQGARAALSICELAPDGGQVCVSPSTCGSRRDCIRDASTADWACEVLPTGAMSTPFCVPECGTIFGCTENSDCIQLPSMLAACTPVASGTLAAAPPSVCTYRPTAGAMTPQAVAYCTADATTHIPAMTYDACHTLPRAPGDPPVYTNDYYRGDCDGDGCPNGADSSPCRISGACASSGFESPLCAPPPPLACERSAAGTVCRDARPCSVTGAPCEGPSACEDGWSMGGARCRPPCSTLFACALIPSTRGPTVEPACPALGAEPGFCVPDPTIAGVTSDPRYDGVCVYSSWDDLSCDLTSVSADCARTIDLAPTASFYEGDCDSDGIPNACDVRRCDPASGPTSCVVVPGGDPRCTVTLVDAGVRDAGSSDAGSSDAGSSDAGSSDAGSSDAGVSVPDAAFLDGSSPGLDSGRRDEDASPAGFRARFGGGGGCRCAAAGSSRARPTGVGVGLALLALCARRGRTRRVALSRSSRC